MDSSTNPVIIDEIEEARNLFSRLQAGDHSGFSTAKGMSDKIRSILKDIKQNVSVLSREGKSEREMEIELVTAAIKLQSADSKDQLKKLKAGDIHISPVFMANRIREDMAAVGQKLDKKMDDDLTKHTVIQQLKRVRQNFSDLSNGVILISPEHMEKSIRGDLADIGKDLSELNTNPKIKISAEEMDKTLKAIVSRESGKLERFNEAKAIYEYLEGKNFSASSRMKIDNILNEMNLDERNVTPKEWVGILHKKLEESGRSLSGLVDGELSATKVKQILDQKIMEDLAKQAKSGESSGQTQKKYSSPTAPLVPNLGLGFTQGR